MPTSEIASPKLIKAKGKCCKDRPRCKKCPVVLKRLSDAGLGEKVDKRHYMVDLGAISKRQLRAARRGEPIPAS